MDRGSHFPRHRHPENRSGRAGFSYVAVLILVTIVTVLALGFLNEVGIEAAAEMSSREATQADYLARAAVNHAMYRLIKESGFPASESKYFMHTLSPGRYGYLVRRHTTRTFATIIGMGIVGDTVVKRSYVLYVKPS